MTKETSKAIESMKALNDHLDKVIESATHLKAFSDAIKRGQENESTNR